MFSQYALLSTLFRMCIYFKSSKSLHFLWNFLFVEPKSVILNMIYGNHTAFDVYIYICCLSCVITCPYFICLSPSFVVKLLNAFCLFSMVLNIYFSLVSDYNRLATRELLAKYYIKIRLRTSNSKSCLLRFT